MHGPFDLHHTPSCSIKIDLFFCQTKEFCRPLLSRSGNEYFHHNWTRIEYLLPVEQKNDCTLLS